MVFLAVHADERPIRCRTIADAEDISEPYTEQILTKLKTCGLVRSHRGTEGGFSLAVDPRSVTVADILRIMEGPIALAPCSDRGCGRMPACVLSAFWRDAAQAMDQALSVKTIADLAEEARTMQETGTLTFQI
jgi:Rrf2 family protein